MEGYKRRNAPGAFGFRINKWEEPSPTIMGRIFNEGKAFVHPGKIEEEREYVFYDKTPQLLNNGLTVAELFCGGGLMAVGLKTAGFNIVWANDFEKTAIDTYKHNIGNHAILGDINKIPIDDIPNTDIIAGGPPCQDYSIAGDGAGEEGDRGKLVYTYLNIISHKQPKAFIFENVKGLLTKKHRHTFDKLIKEFKNIGYNVSWKLINVWDYGVAQKRERVIIVGIRKDFEFNFQFPEPQPEDFQSQLLRDAIGDLPDPLAFPIKENHNQFWTPKSEYSYDQANRVMSMDSPSNTIPAHHNSGQPIHPTQQHRRFSVRECLRIQSAPDWFVIPNHIKLSPAYRIVGNGVPCRVAWYLGKSLAEQLLKSKI